MSSRWLRLAPPILVATGMNLGLLALFHLPARKRLIGDESYYLARALEYAAGEVPRHVPLWPALYSELVGRLFALFAVHPLPVQVPQIVMWLLTALLFGDIAGRTLQSRPAACATLLLLLFSPELMAFSHFLWPETAHLFLFSFALWLLVRAEDRWPARVLAGVSLGAALLLKLLLLGFLPILLAFLVLRGSGSWPRRIAKTLLLAAAVGVTVFPTLRHNRELHGRWMIAESGVFNLWVGLSDVERADHRDDRASDAFEEFQEAGPSFDAREGAFRERIRTLIEAEGWPALAVRQLGKQVFRLLDHHTFFTTQLPGGPRAAYQLDAPGLIAWIRGYAYAFHALLLGAGVIGLAALRLRPLGWMHVVAAFIVYNLALFLLMHVKTRYFVQLIPMLALGAGITAQQLVDLVRGRGLSSTPAFEFTPPRIAVGLAGAALVEWIAFHEAFAS
jgi:hypothetical protein